MPSVLLLPSPSSLLAACLSALLFVAGIQVAQALLMEGPEGLKDVPRNIMLLLRVCFPPFLVLTHPCRGLSQPIFSVLILFFSCSRFFLSTFKMLSLASSWLDALL